MWYLSIIAKFRLLENVFFIKNGIKSSLIDSIFNSEVFSLNFSFSIISKILSLKEFNEPRKNKSFVDAYINGQYGAIPDVL